MTQHTPASLVRTEAEALLALANRLEGPMAADFDRAVELLLQCGEDRGRVVVTGMGKSGIVAQKIAATLSSTGSPALFLHPAEALHGDLGVLMQGDVVIALSASGETEEILRLLATLKRIGRRSDQFLLQYRVHARQASDVALDCSVEKEACGLGLAPTASTTAMLALGDALAIAVSLRKGFQTEDFADLHPGGKLGKKLARVRQLMHAGEDVPRVERSTLMTEVIYEMSRKGLGLATVQEGSEAGRRNQRRRLTSVAPARRTRSPSEICRRSHELHAKNYRAGRIGCPGAKCDGRQEDHRAGRSGR